MRHTIALSMLILWGPITLMLARALGARRGVLIGLLGGFLLLPRSPIIGWLPFGFLTLDRRTIPGLAALVAILLFDRRGLSRLRPRAIDLAAIGFVLSPMMAWAAHGFRSSLGSINEFWIHGTEWGLPYLIGRIYFAEGNGPRQLGTAVAIAGLLYVPLILFEGVLGPDWYLAGRIYGIDYNHGMESRLGGWRPETFLNNGLELAEWMGLAATMASWLWICSGWTPSPFPQWLPAPLLVFGSLAVRGVYGYAVLAIGLSLTVLTRLFRVPWFLMALTLVPPIYLAVRISGLWDAQALVHLAERVGNRGTVEVRIRFEGEGIALARDAGLVFGEGTRYPDWWADGRWVATLRGSGLVGVGFQYAAILGPAALLIWRRRTSIRPTSPEMGLALFVVLHAIDSLHNTALIVPAPICCGALAGASLLGVSRPNPSGRPTRSRGEGGHATYRIQDVGKPMASPVEALEPLAPVLAIACVLYVFGHASVEGQEGLKFVGGLGSALLFAAAGASAAVLRHHPGRLASFGLAFGLLGISFNLGLHPSNRPVWSADILQGMALSGILVALWRPRGSGQVAAFAALMAIGASWWAWGGTWQPFPGSQYLYFSGDVSASLFPLLPWLCLSVVGAILVGVSAPGAWSMTGGFGLAAWMSWQGEWPFGPPSKFPMNPTYALLGASMASAAFAFSGPIRAWSWSRACAEWLGRRWLVFFYLHLGIAVVLGRIGLTNPGLSWAVLITTSMAATWLVTAATDRARVVFRWPMTWLAMGFLTIAIGLIPGVPSIVVQGVAGVSGLLFAARYGDLGSLILGPPRSDRDPIEAMNRGDHARYLARLALVVVILGGPELVARLPSPLGTAGSSRSGDSR